MIFENPPRYLVDDGQGYIVIPDLHGRLQDLELVLEQYPDRQLIFLDDLVDRGPDTRGVIAKVRELVEGGRARLCMGNHEWMLLAAVGEVIDSGDFGSRGALWLANGGDVVMAEYGNDFPALMLDAEWLSRHAEQWVVADGGLFCHAHRLPAWIIELYESQGPEALSNDPEATSVILRAMPHLWNRPGDDLEVLPEGITYSVHGHTPQKYGRPLLQEDAEGKDAFFIDLGAVFHFGYFGVFDTADLSARVFPVAP